MKVKTIKGKKVLIIGGGPMTDIKLQVIKDTLETHPDIILADDTGEAIEKLTKMEQKVFRKAKPIERHTDQRKQYRKSSKRI